MKRIIVLTVVLAALPVAAPAQQADADARIEAAIAAAVEAGVPAVLLERKVTEGQAKAVAAERIAAAVETRAEALIRASHMLRAGGVQGAGGAELSVVADALTADVDEALILRLHASAQGSNRVVATAVLTDLVRLGHASDVAFARVSGAVSAGSGALANLRAETAASLRARGMVGVRTDGLLP